MIVEKLMNPSEPRDLATIRETLSNQEDPISRLVAANRLLTGDSRPIAESAIAKGLDSSDTPTRSLALAFAMKDGALWQEVASKLGRATDATMTMMALKAIMDLNQQGRFKDVVGYFTSEDRDVSLTAAKALAVLDKLSAQSIFEGELHSKIAHVRVFSAGMLLAPTEQSGRKPRTHPAANFELT